MTKSKTKPAEIWRITSPYGDDLRIDFPSKKSAENHVKQLIENMSPSERKYRSEFFITPMHKIAHVIKNLKKLLNFRCEGIPVGFTRRLGYCKGDEEAPFFSEAFLYVLLGKDDARSVLARINHLCVSLGIDNREQDRMQEAKEEET